MTSPDAAYADVRIDPRLLSGLGVKEAAKALTGEMEPYALALLQLLAERPECNRLIFEVTLSNDEDEA